MVEDGCGRETKEIRQWKAEDAAANGKRNP